MAVRSEFKDRFSRRPPIDASEDEEDGARSSRLVALLVAAAVALAFADSSIVLLALPQLYGELHTSIEGVAWVVTAYNAAVAVAAFALILFVHRLRARAVLAGGLIIFLGASIACALADSLSLLVAARTVQGVGAALLLAGSLPVLAVLTGSAGRGAALWTLAGTFGAALGPALGGVLTQGFDWRAIFAFQAPVAALGLIGAVRAHVDPVVEEGYTPRSARTLPANICLGLVFGALVGVLFLSVLLVISVWGHSPIRGAAIVSVLPAATLAVRPLARRLPGTMAVQGGAALLVGGLLGLALLPSTNVGFMVWALGLCGAGLGLAVPVLSNAALDLSAGLTRSGTLTIGIRHLGLVLALAAIAPVLAGTLPAAGDRAMLRATAVILDAPIGLSKKVPIALDLRSAFNQAQDGQRPDLSKPFDEHGAATDEQLASTRDELIGVIERTITRAFRPAFALSAAFAALALALALLMRGRLLG
jgi:predicted MFS family arabinose efflux permease